jgi:hypothetical protein
MPHLYTITFADKSTLPIVAESIGEALHKAWLQVYTETGRDKEVIKIERNQ